MAEYKFKVKTNSPTGTLIDRLINRYAGGSDDITVAYLRIKDSSGTVLGQASVSPSDWSNHTITKSVTITTGGSAAAFTLESSDGAELYRYAVSLSLNAGDVVTITWTIGISLGSNCTGVNYVLENIEGTATTTNLKINGVTFFEAGSAIKTFDSSNATVSVTPDTTNDRVIVTITFTSNSNFGYDSFELINPEGKPLISVTASGGITAGIQTTFKVTISIGAG